MPSRGIALEKEFEKTDAEMQRTQRVLNVLPMPVFQRFNIFFQQGGRYSVILPKAGRQGGINGFASREGHKR